MQLGVTSFRAQDVVYLLKQIKQPLTADIHIDHIAFFPPYKQQGQPGAIFFTWWGEGPINPSPLSCNRLWRTLTLLTSHRSLIILTGPEEQCKTEILEA